jgi:hypothetical protein
MKHKVSPAESSGTSPEAPDSNPLHPSHILLPFSYILQSYPIHRVPPHTVFVLFNIIILVKFTPKLNVIQYYSPSWCSGHHSCIAFCKSCLNSGPADRCREEFHKAMDEIQIKHVKTVKVRMSLYLTKYHAIKTYPVLNYEPRHEDVRRSGGIAPRILNLGTRWR